MRKAFFISVILAMCVPVMFAQEKDMDYYLYRGKETFSIVHGMFGVIAHDDVPVYKDMTHEFGEEPIFFMKKNDVVNFLRVSKDSWQYKAGDNFHRWKIETLGDWREGWISGHDVILISNRQNFVPLYRQENSYFYINGGAEFDGTFQPPFTRLVTGTAKGGKGYWNGGVEYMELGSGDTPFYTEYDNPHYEDKINVLKWDEEAGNFVSQVINTSRDPSDWRYVEESSLCSENDAILTTRESFKSEEYYALIRAIETKDMGLLEKVIATGYRAEVMDEDESPLVRAVKCKNKDDLNRMLSSGFTDAVFVPVPEWDDVAQISIDEWQKRK